jgi:hypothetical protein
MARPLRFDRFLATVYVVGGLAMLALTVAVGLLADGAWADGEPGYLSAAAGAGLLAMVFICVGVAGFARGRAWGRGLATVGLVLLALDIAGLILATGVSLVFGHGFGPVVAAASVLVLAVGTAPMHTAAARDLRASVVSRG